jgi:hypothetical protein
MISLHSVCNPPLEKVEPNTHLEKVEPNTHLEKVEPNTHLEKINFNVKVLYLIIIFPYQFYRVNL